MNMSKTEICEYLHEYPDGETWCTYKGIPNPLCNHAFCDDAHTVISKEYFNQLIGKCECEPFNVPKHRIYKGRK